MIAEQQAFELLKQELLQMNQEYMNSLSQLSFKEFLTAGVYHNHLLLRGDITDKELSLSTLRAQLIRRTF